MGRTGDSVRRLTTDGFNPSWSPDGNAIVYATEGVEFTPQGREARSVLWTVSTTNGEQRQLTTTDAMQPAWCHMGIASHIGGSSATACSATSGPYRRAAANPSA